MLAAIRGGASEQSAGEQSRARGNYRDNYSEKHAGKPYTDAHLRRQGYALANTFPYELPDGTKLYEERRYELRANITPSEERPRKTCRFCHTVDGDDRFDTGPRRIIYNWPAIMRAGPGATVHITEGANKSAALNAVGLLATAVAYHKWEPECVAGLAGHHLIYHEDFDDNGRKFSADARKHLVPVAASFRIVPVAHLFKTLGREPWPTADVKDWLEAGGDPAKLTEICREIPAASTLQSMRAEDVIMSAVEWLWPNRFAIGKLGLIVGLPEEGANPLLYRGPSDQGQRRRVAVRRRLRTERQCSPAFCRRRDRRYRSAATRSCRRRSQTGHHHKHGARAERRANVQSAY